MICDTIQPYILFQGECGENQFIQLNEFTRFSVSNRLWRGSKNQRVLFSTYRRGKSESGSVQEVGEAQ